MAFPPIGGQQRGRACRTASAAAAPVVGRRPSREQASWPLHRAIRIGSHVRPVPQPHDLIARALRGAGVRSLIIVFTALLSMPAATTSGKSPPLADAVFTAVSTICVTGLSTVDIATYFSPLGKFIIFARREHRRHGRAHARVDPGPGHLQAPRAARQAHRGERHQSAPHATAVRSTRVRRCAWARSASCCAPWRSRRC